MSFDQLFCQMQQFDQNLGLAETQAPHMAATTIVAIGNNGDFKTNIASVAMTTQHNKVMPSTWAGSFAAMLGVMKLVTP